MLKISLILLFLCTVASAQCELLIKTNHLNYSIADEDKNRAGVWKKGDIVTVKDLPHNGWGNKEGLPRFVIVRITDATKSQVINYINSWKRQIEYNVVASNALGKRIEAWCDNRGELGLGSLTRNEVETWIMYRGGSVFSVSSDTVTFDILNDSIPAFKEDVKDYLERVIFRRQYYIPSNVMDTIINQDGYIETTRTQFLNYLRNRREEH